MDSTEFILNETSAEASLRLGTFVSFYRWNGVIYGLDPDGVVPATQSSGYIDGHKDLIDAAIADLASKPNGKWVFVPKRKKWEQVPISMLERLFIARFDETINSDVPPSTPMNPVFPR